jgi:hypothetical protein
MRRHYFSATVLLVIGFYFLLPRIFNVLGFAFPIDFAIFRNLFWAILFIVVGLAIIFGRGEIKRISI